MLRGVVVPVLFFGAKLVFIGGGILYFVVVVGLFVWFGPDRVIMIPHVRLP
jgi:hypothetical protein